VRNELKIEYEDHKIKYISKSVPPFFGHGAKVRFGYSFFAIFAQYEILSDLLSTKKLSVGIELSVPW